MTEGDGWAEPIKHQTLAVNAQNRTLGIEVAEKVAAMRCE